MGLIKNFITSRLVSNAVQEQQRTLNISMNNFNPYEELFGGMTKNGKYDNFYGNSNRIVTGAAKYPLYYVRDDKKIEPDEANFAYYLTKLNDSYPQRKVLEQIYTQLITHGHSDIFLWRKEGKTQSNHFDEKKKYREDDFRGLTLVSGYDRLTYDDKKNIISITYGANQANVFMGYSPTQAVMSYRKMQDEMGLHMTKFAQNAGMPLGTWIITAQSVDDYKKIRDGLEGKIAGAKNAGKQLFSYQPSDVKTPQIHWQEFTSREVQDYIPQMEFAEKKMTTAFGVPGTVKGTNDGENYSTASVSKQNFVEWTIEPLVSTLREQLEFAIANRFDVKGEIKADVVIPELADESLVRIRTTTMQTQLYERKLAEGYTKESIVAAYDLPERFLLLEKEGGDVTLNKFKKNTHKTHIKNEFLRQYQSKLTQAEMDRLEEGFRKITESYRDQILAGKYDNDLRVEYEGKMQVNFSGEYVNLYNKALDDVSEALLDELGVVDLAELDLTEEELLQAERDYLERVKNFSKTFAEGIEELEGETLAVRSMKSQSHVKRVVISEAEHTRIVSELKAWTKSIEEFPVRVWKTWNARPDACDLCTDLADVTIDVTNLFPTVEATDEIYEVQGGGYHPNCRCWVTYEMEAK